MASVTERAREHLLDYKGGIFEEALDDVALLNRDTLDGALQAAFVEGWKQAYRRALGREFWPGVDPQPPSEAVIA